MITYKKNLNVDLTKFTAEQLEEAKQHRTKIPFLTVGEIYGGANATVKGIWRGAFVNATRTENGKKTETPLKWRCVFSTEIGKDGDKVVYKNHAEITPNWLLRLYGWAECTAMGSVREWAKEYWKEHDQEPLDEDWVKDLAELLNNRGFALNQIGEDNDNMSVELNFAD